MAGHLSASTSPESIERIDSVRGPSRSRFRGRAVQQPDRVLAAVITVGTELVQDAPLLSETRLTIPEVDSSRVEVARSGDLAVEYGTFAMTVKDKKGKSTTQTEKYIVTWKKQADGKWKAVGDIWNAYM